MPFASQFDRWLAGVRVLDFTAVLAGPHLTRVLAQAGADVIKLEALAGDTTRGLPYKYGDGQSGYFKQQNIGKRGIAVNLATPEGHAIAIELARRSDVVVENFRPGVMEKMGLGFEALRAIQPRMVYVSISGWGQTGPYAKLTGEVRSTTALSGLMAADATGVTPGWERCSFGDTNSSLHGVAAIGAGLLRARRTGQGTYVDISILEALMSANSLEMPEVLCGEGGLDGTESRMGGDHARVASGTFVCNDGQWLYLRALTDAAWRGLAATVGLDAAWHGLSGAARRPQAGAIYAAIEAWCGARPLGAALDQLNAAGVSAVPVRSVREVLASGAVHDAGLVQRVDDAFAGELDVPVGLFASKAFGGQRPHPEPGLGEHTREVLTGVLGYDEAQVDALAARGVVAESRVEAEA